MDSKGNSPAAELQFRGGAAGRAGASRTPPEPDGEGVRILGALRLAFEAVPGRGHRAAQAEVGDAALLSLAKTMIRVEFANSKTMIRVESVNSKTMIRDFPVASARAAHGNLNEDN